MDLNVKLVISQSMLKLDHVIVLLVELDHKSMLTLQLVKYVEKGSIQMILVTANHALMGHIAMSLELRIVLHVLVDITLMVPLVYHVELDITQVMAKYVYPAPLNNIHPLIHPVNVYHVVLDLKSIPLEMGVVYAL